jgi:hypothetical protein
MVSMKNTMDVDMCVIIITKFYVCVIIITKFYVLSKGAWVTVYAYSNRSMFVFLERSLAKVHLLVLILESLIKFHL